MRTLAITLACLCALPISAAELIGAVVPPYPDGMTSDMGSCVSEGDQFCAYTIASLHSVDGSVVSILAQKLIKYVNGDPVWEIVDAREAPVHSANQLWAFEECRVDGIIDPSAAGLVTFRDMGGWLESDKTVWAARLDVETQRLVQLNPEEVSCTLPGS